MDKFKSRYQHWRRDLLSNRSIQRRIAELVEALGASLLTGDQLQVTLYR